MNEMTTINGGDGSPPEPDWSSIYADEFDIAAAHHEWGIVVRELRASVTLSVALPVSTGVSTAPLAGATA